MKNSVKVLGTKGNLKVVNDNNSIDVYRGDEKISSGSYEWESSAFWFFSWTKAFDEVEDILNFFLDAEVLRARFAITGIE